MGQDLRISLFLFFGIVLLSLTETTAQLDAVGVTLSNLGVPVGVVAPGPESSPDVNSGVQYVALAAHNNVPGLVVPNTQFGVPYVEFTATEAALNQVASFYGALMTAATVDGELVYPFTPDQELSPGCQVTVNFKAYKP